jgi:hypothetical protein
MIEARAAVATIDDHSLARGKAQERRIALADVEENHLQIAPL